MPTERRRFLSLSAKGAVVATVLPSARLALGSQANQRIRLGVVGQGGRGRMLTGMFADHGGYEVVAVADYFPEVARAGAAAVDVPEKAAFSGLSAYKRLLDYGVDAVALQTPPYFFPIHAAAAVDAGCHVYVAKPVAIDVPGCKTIAELGRRSTAQRRVFHVDFQLRYMPQFVQCLEYLRQGKLGKIRFVRAYYNDEGREDRRVQKDISELFTRLRWAMCRELGGDRIVSAGIHAVDTALAVIGTHPLKVCGVVQQSRANPVNTAMDTASLTYTFPDGVIMNYSGDQFRNYHYEIDLFAGVKAYADSGYMQTHYGKASIPGAGDTKMRSGDWRYEGGEMPDLYHWGARHNIELFHTCITKGQFENTTVPTAVEANPTCLMGAYAGRRGGEMTWDELLNDEERAVPDLSGLKD
ncbi:MAG: gfo/Idh/MocA family oxidoreductase [Planctomycetota bacterium]|nr:MAG: gfo/Idh/MocA family oxidoreductase [Planctomycetota bacterium]